MLSHTDRLEKIYEKLNNQFNNHPTVKNLQWTQVTQRITDKFISILEEQFFVCANREEIEGDPYNACHFLAVYAVANNLSNARNLFAYAPRQNNGKRLFNDFLENINQTAYSYWAKSFRNDCHYMNCYKKQLIQRKLDDAIITKMKHK